MLVLSLLTTFCLTFSALASPLPNEQRPRYHTHGSAPFPARKMAQERALADHPDGTPQTNSTQALARLDIGALLDSIKPHGKAESVKLTWYSGSGLLNPSCWAQAVWQPTDNSYVCAVTMDESAEKPDCLSFLSLCSGTRCISCRVVDTCAGCQANHVDVSPAVFKALAPLSQGVITDVKMSSANEPNEWDTSLWGPKST